MDAVLGQSIRSRAFAESLVKGIVTGHRGSLSLIPDAQLIWPLITRLLCSPRDDPHGVDDSRNVAQQGEQDVEPEPAAETNGQEHSERGSRIARRTRRRLLMRLNPHFGCGWVGRHPRTGAVFSAPEPRCDRTEIILIRSLTTNLDSKMSSPTSLMYSSVLRSNPAP